MKLPILKMIEAYIESRKRAWADSTLRSERHRLNGVAGALDGDPEKLWQHLEASGMAPYARVTTWSRVTSFWQWAIEKGHVKNEGNLYSQFRRDNARLFKNTYQRSIPKISFAEAKERISRMAHSAVRETAQEFLSSGTRWIDAERQEGDIVVGKGGRRRRVAVSRNGSLPVSYRTFLRQLEKETGLKPHALRKIFATHMWRSGEFDVLEFMKMMGWNKLDTATSYIGLAEEDELMARIKKVIGE